MVKKEEIENLKKVVSLFLAMYQNYSVKEISEYTGIENIEYYLKDERIIELYDNETYELIQEKLNTKTL